VVGTAGVFVANRRGAKVPLVRPNMATCAEGQNEIVAGVLPLALPCLHSNICYTVTLLAPLALLSHCNTQAPCSRFIP
jgi:hypothetical protein